MNPTNRSKLEYAQASTEALHSGLVYDEYSLKKPSIEGLRQ